MSIQPGAQLHFRCSFELRASSELVGDPFLILLKTIRKWVSEAPFSDPPPTNEQFRKLGWFSAQHGDGQWKAPGRRLYQVATARCQGEGSSDNPQYWAMEYIHDSASPGSRVWTTNVGITRLAADRFSFAIAVHHHLPPGALDIGLERPMPSVPGLVNKLLTSRVWSCHSGDEKLARMPHILHPACGARFIELLEDAERECPLIYVSQVTSDRKTLIDPYILAKRLAGAAIVVVPTEPSVDDEVERLVPNGFFSCFNGAVRLYMPLVRLDDPRDARRHQLIRPWDIRDEGIAEVESAIVRSVARRAPLVQRNVVWSVADVARIRREHELRRSREQLASMSETEKVETIEKLLDLADIEINEANSQIRQLTAKRDELEAALESAEYTRDHWKDRALTAEQEQQAVASMLERLACLRKIPCSLGDVLDTAASFFEDTLSVSDEARRDAAEVADCTPARLWEALFDMATVLRGLVFGKEATNDFTKVFQDRTGIELAMTETGTTKNQSKMMAERRLVLEGVEYDITPHLKLVKGGSRLYFAIDREKSRFVVGRLGHLTTAGTRRQGR